MVEGKEEKEFTIITHPGIDPLSTLIFIPLHILLAIFNSNS